MRFTRLLCLLLTAAILPSGAMASAGPPDQGELTKTYDFENLPVNCGFLVTTSGAYEDLVFPTPAYLAPCNTPNGTIGLVPSEFGAALREIRVQLPSAASAVSIETYLFDAGGDATLVGYDAEGAEVASVSNGMRGSWVALEVRGNGATIVEVGLRMPQLAVYLDNLTVTYGSADSGENPEEDPEELPAELPSENPATRADCTNGRWADYGFRNQGQCVSFVMTAKDSR
ncbi:MAG: hypothetical protein OEO79_02590 [Gemmatimonadota bacterium]|nr:hypothetical protein [Gemmatimonadota bacterium]MDH3423643.1 hypothetical protein [Gemmatimonadota bacterium]